MPLLCKHLDIIPEVPYQFLVVSIRVRALRSTFVCSRLVVGRQWLEVKVLIELGYSDR